MEGVSSYNQGIDTSLQYIRGIGPTRARLLKRLQLKTVGDALFFLPRRYEDRSKIKKITDLKIRKYETFTAYVLLAGTKFIRRGRRIFEVVFGDDSGTITGKW